MLQFLRKHQKYFFIVITATIVISFCFFGTYSTLGQQEAVPDKEIGKGAAGKPIMQQELAALCRLIETSPFDHSVWEKGGMPNFFNDGVIERDFLSEGLGTILAARYFEDLKPELELRVRRIHQYRAYVHPKAPQISVEGIWARFSPGFLERYRQLKAKSDFPTPESIALMGQLYVEQAMFPPDRIRQFLMMQQNQMGITPDPVLANADLFLFGFKNLEEWFGPKFIALAGQFILNAAQIAEENGIEVRTEEVRADLYRNIYRGFQQTSPQASPGSEDVAHYYQARMRHLNLDEAMLFGAWKKVMLFRRLFEKGSGSVLVDPLAYAQFTAYARERARIELYQLPQELRLGSYRSMLQLQTYLEAIAVDPTRARSDAHMPKQLATLEQIEKRTPELVERGIEVQWSAVSKEELCQLLSIKETWAWEAEDLHWDLLQKNFPELVGNQSVTAQQRLSFLGTLDSVLRHSIDQFARTQMIGEQPEKIRDALDANPMDTSVIGLRKKGSVLPFHGMKENPELIALLESASLQTEAPNAAAERLAGYSPDGDNFYKIRVVRKELEKKVLTFAESVEDGTLDRLLDKRLEEAYPEIRRKEPHYFQQANGQWKPFREVKDQVGKRLYADLLKVIEQGYLSHYGLLPGHEGDLPLNFYSNARLLLHMKQAQKGLQENPAGSVWVKAGSNATGPAAQWLLEKTEETVERCSQVPFSKEEMFTSGTGYWSKVETGERGALAFYFVKERILPSEPSLQSVDEGRQILGGDAKRDMMVQILQRIQKSRAIDLSATSGEKP
jgi:hypothetical protein